MCIKWAIPWKFPSRLLDVVIVVLWSWGNVRCGKYITKISKYVVRVDATFIYEHRGLESRAITSRSQFRVWGSCPWRQSGRSPHNEVGRNRTLSPHIYTISPVDLCLKGQDINATVCCLIYYRTLNSMQCWCIHQIDHPFITEYFEIFFSFHKKNNLICDKASSTKQFIDF